MRTNLRSLRVRSFPHPPFTRTKFVFVSGARPEGTQCGEIMCSTPLLSSSLIHCSPLPPAPTESCQLQSAASATSWLIVHSVFSSAQLCVRLSSDSRALHSFDCAIELLAELSNGTGSQPRNIFAKSVYKRGVGMGLGKLGENRAAKFKLGRGFGNVGDPQTCYALERKTLLSS